MDERYVKNDYQQSYLTAKVIAAATEVHRALGPGFEEVIYQRALSRELPVHELDHSREVWIDVSYKGERIGRKRVDFVIGLPSVQDAVLLEIKAKATLEDVDYIQTLSYLKASGFKIGLLINFGTRKLEIRRLAN